MKSIKYTLVFLLLIVFSVVSAQKTCGDIDNKKAVRLYEKGAGLFEKARKSRKNSTQIYRDGIACLKEALEEEPDFPEVNFLIGEFNFKKKNFQVACRYLEKTYAACPEYPDVYLYFYLGNLAYQREKWADAESMFALFMQDVDKVKTDKDYNVAEFLHKKAKFYNKLYSNPVYFNPETVSGISTASDEYLPIITPDEEWAFFTRRYEKQALAQSAWATESKYVERFSMAQKQDDEFEKGDALPPPFNISQNEGGATLTVDNRFLYYTVCAATSSRYYNCDICFTENQQGNWTEVQNLGNVVNDSRSWDAQPSVSSDGKTLFFVSDRPGGLGGYDIWYTTKDENGQWGSPQNVGAPINTPGNERSPFMHTDSETLYFTSSDRYDEANDKWYDGHMGLGGYDIFYAKKGADAKWTKPTNIGYPINSKEDEVGFFVSTNGKRGYFASNKKELGGNGSWDLYVFDLYKEARPEKVLFIKGNVNEEGSEDPVEAEIKLINAKTKEVKEIPIDKSTGQYVVAMKFDEDYVMEVKKDGYAYNAKYLSKEDTAFEQPKKLDFDVQKVEVGGAYTLNDIFFATNSTQLTVPSMIVIDGFVDFLKSNPKLSVSINGHTDNVGDDQANMQLSTERAKSVYEYMIAGGVDAGRLRYKGYGETRPIADNATEAGRAKNRRTEFEIVQK